MNRRTTNVGAACVIGAIIIGSVVCSFNNIEDNNDNLAEQVVQQESVAPEGSDPSLSMLEEESSEQVVMLAAEEETASETVPETEAATEAETQAETEPETEAAKVIPGYTNLGIANVEGYLNVREAPGTENKIVGKIPTNGACEIISEINGWYQVTSGSVSGYVSGEFIMTGDEAYNKAIEIQTEVAVVTCDVLNLREQPNTECQVLDQVPTGQELEIVSKRDDNWVEIKVDDVTLGFASMDFVEFRVVLPVGFTMEELQVQIEAGITQKRIDVVQYAMNFLGNPYVWGGTSLTNGCDCSGFVQSVYSNFGYYLDRNSAAQADDGTSVSLSDLKPGDLVFYASGSSINHVAMYVGNGQIIQAKSENAGIVISSLNYRTPYSATRIIND